MAILITPSPLGRISGRIGDVVFRNYPDKTVVGMRPQSFTPGSDIASVQRRLRFKLTAMFSKCIKNIAPAYELWDQYTKKKMSAYNLIFKNNYKAVFYDYISDYVQIFPKIDFLIKPESISINKESFHINFLPEDSHLTGIDSPSYLQMAAIIFCKEPIDPSDSKFSFINYISDPVEIIDNWDLSFDLSFQENPDYGTNALNQHDSAVFTRYNYHSVFVSFLALNSEKTFIQNSQTISLLNT